MKSSVRDLAQQVEGSVVGNEDLVISSARSLDLAGPDDLSFLESDKHATKLTELRAGAVVVPRDFAMTGRTLIRVADPLMAFVALYRHLHELPGPGPVGINSRADVHPSAVVARSATIKAFAVVGEGCVIGERCQLGNGAVIGARSRIGDDVVVHANVVLYDRSVVGNRVTIHAGAVIGVDGFGYRMRGGQHVKVPQLGNVEIGDDVEIGANSTIDRATFDTTRIGEGSKIDNLVQVGHNCTIGRHNILVAQCGFGGSSDTGDYVIVAGQAGISDHISIGAGAIINPQAGVAHDVKPRQRVSGTPAKEYNDFLREIWATGRLPGWSKDLKLIKSRLGMKD